MIRAGIIAAGEGSRLARSHPTTIKPLVTVAGKPLMHWIVDGLLPAGCREMTILTNSRGTAVPASLTAAFPDVKFDFVTADTASSFESFRLVSLRLAETEKDFVISTTDALIRNDDVVKFIKECRASRVEAGLALTKHVDDEKPLWADLDEVGLVTALGDGAKTRRFVTCGLYYLTASAAARLPSADAHKRLRDFLSALVAEARVAGVILSKTLDVDRPEDLAAAEKFLTTETPR